MFHFCSAPDAIPDLRQSNFQGLTLNKNGLIAVGEVQAHTPITLALLRMALGFQILEIFNSSNLKVLWNTSVSQDTMVHCLQIKGTKIDITQKWQLEGPATTAMYSPDYETLLLSSNTVGSQKQWPVIHKTHYITPNNYLRGRMYFKQNDRFLVLQGHIYMLSPTRSDKIVKVLDVCGGSFVAAAWLHTDKNICVVKQFVLLKNYSFL